MNELLGLDRQATDLTFFQIALRSVVIFFAVLLMLRISQKRFLARRNALDTLLGFLLASMLARAINGSERLFESIGAGFILVLLHRTLTWSACRFHTIGRLLKGQPEVLIENGQVHKNVMNRLHISQHDLDEDLRLKTGSEDTSQIAHAMVERNGELSVSKQEQAGRQK